MSYISKVLSGKCPHCGKEKVFHDKGSVLTFRMPKMTKECPSCGYNFHRETGFYFGAMYVSYAITVAEMVAVMVGRLILNSVFGLEINLLQTFIAIVVVILLSWTFTYRAARIMWLNMFYSED
ncbi:MAG: DUF983 domain-containing protein [Flavobacteriaceae bacterium]|jgi:uncharacterized protein (DUF983 family)|nr:DUF983 domain-containing protein [Flavobacteriaceae bacterium]